MTTMTARVENTPKTNGPEIYKLIERVAMVSDIFEKEFFWRLEDPLGIDVRKMSVYISSNREGVNEGVNIDIHGVSEEDFIRILKMRPTEEARRSGVRATFYGEWAAADIVTVRDQPQLDSFRNHPDRFKQQMNKVTIFSENYKENTPEWQRLKKAVDEFNEALEREVSHVG